MRGNRSPSREALTEVFKRRRLDDQSIDLGRYRQRQLCWIGVEITTGQFTLHTVVDTKSLLVTRLFALCITVSKSVSVEKRQFIPLKISFSSAFGRLCGPLGCAAAPTRSVVLSATDTEPVPSFNGSSRLEASMTLTLWPAILVLIHQPPADQRVVYERL